MYGLRKHIYILQLSFHKEETQAPSTFSFKASISHRSFSPFFISHCFSPQFLGIDILDKQRDKVTNGRGQITRGHEFGYMMLSTCSRPFSSCYRKIKIRISQRYRKIMIRISQRTYSFCFKRVIRWKYRVRLGFITPIAGLRD